MGKGDIKTKRGKIIRGSYGRTRPHSKGEPKVEAESAPKKTAKKKTATKAKKKK